VSDETIKSCIERCEPYRHKLAAFFQLKMVLAPCIEAVVTLDRLCYLLEQVCVNVYHVLFDGGS